MTRIASATSPASRSSGVMPCGARICGPRGPRPPPPPPCGPPPGGRPPVREGGAISRVSSSTKSKSRMSSSCTVTVKPRPSRWRSTLGRTPSAVECTGDSAAEDVPLVRRRTVIGVVRSLRSPRSSARPRPLSTPQAARSRRLGIGVARPGRADRARGRAQDRST